jgi:hypothetical protein
MTNEGSAPWLFWMETMGDGNVCFASKRWNVKDRDLDVISEAVLINDGFEQLILLSRVGSCSKVPEPSEFLNVLGDQVNCCLLSRKAKIQCSCIQLTSFIQKNDNVSGTFALEELGH